MTGLPGVPTMALLHKIGTDFTAIAGYLAHEATLTRSYDSLMMAFIAEQIAHDADFLVLHMLLGKVTQGNDVPADVDGDMVELNAWLELKKRIEEVINSNDVIQFAYGEV